MRVRRRARAAAGMVTLALAVGGTFVLSAATAGAVDVGDEAAFRTAWDTEAEITLTADITLTCDAGGDADRTGDGDVTVNGAGHSIAMQDGCIDRVLHVTAGSDSSVTLSNLTVRGGRTPSFGGGILLENDGSLTVVDSSLTDNIACSDGGAIDVEDEGESSTLTVIRSTLSGNAAPNALDGAPSEGGAIWASDVETTIVNSTITGNSASIVASAVLVLSDGSLDLMYSDVVGNVIEDVDCPFVVPGSTDDEPASHDEVTAAEVEDGQIATETFRPFGSVITGAVGSSNCEVELVVTESAGYNVASDESCGLAHPTDRQDVSDPLLGELAANGGPTLTLLPEAGSPLLDQIPAGACGGPAGDITTDQRGVTRPQGTTCDIGAVEIEILVPAPLVVIPTFTG